MQNLWTLPCKVSPLTQHVFKKGSGIPSWVWEMLNNIVNRYITYNALCEWMQGGASLCQLPLNSQHPKRFAINVAKHKHKVQPGKSMKQQRFAHYFTLLLRNCWMSVIGNKTWIWPSFPLYYACFHLFVPFLTVMMYMVCSKLEVSQAVIHIKLLISISWEPIFLSHSLIAEPLEMCW